MPSEWCFFWFFWERILGRILDAISGRRSTGKTLSQIANSTIHMYYLDAIAL